jgi:hypothetical protein
MAGGSLNSSNIVINAVDVFWRIESRSLIDVSAEVNPDGTYFDLFDTDGATARVYFDLDAGSVVPADPGRLIEVDVTTGDAPSVIAAAVQAAIDADSKFSASVSGNVVQVDSVAVGEVTDPDAGTSASVVTVCYKGKDFNLGLLEGEPSPTFEPSTFDVTSHQGGTTILAKLVQGYTASVETVLQESTKSRLSTLFALYGEKFTPGGGTEVAGAGLGALGKNLVTEAARLEFVPRSDLGPELSYQYTFRLAIPVPGSLLFSGENPRTLTVTWDAIPDLGATRPGLDTVVIGDISQDGVL